VRLQPGSYSVTTGEYDPEDHEDSSENENGWSCIWCRFKLYFVDHRPDDREIVVETEPGDLTVHDGRLWHRGAQSTKTGPESLRRTMYMPFINDAPSPRDEESKTLPYHYLGQDIREGRNAWFRLRRSMGRV
jgi:ectoine hydroxylase-related dioxygenase (phytanoyl-CoA dioxygenase family)